MPVQCGVACSGVRLRRAGSGRLTRDCAGSGRTAHDTTLLSTSRVQYTVSVCRTTVPYCTSDIILYRVLACYGLLRYGPVITCHTGKPKSERNGIVAVVFLLFRRSRRTRRSRFVAMRPERDMSESVGHVHVNFHLVVSFHLCI